MLRAWLDKINPPGPAESYRRAARARLREQDVRHPSRDVVELGALTLFERELATRPRAEVTGKGRTQVGEPRSLARTACYTGQLAATLGISGPFSPAVLHVLDDFKPELLWKNNPNSRLLGGLDRMEQSQQVLRQENRSFSVGGQTIQVTGVAHPAELANLEAAVRKLHEKLPAAVKLLDTIHLRPFLGYVPGTPSKVNGLAGSKPGQVALENLVARDPKGAQGTLYHELGHLLDRHLGTALRARTGEPNTPFGDNSQTVSRYARTSPAEDLAETHKFLLEKLDNLLANPDLVHASGAIGQKLGWILDEGYQQPLPGPSHRLQAILSDLEHSPFGWQTPQGVVGAREDLARCALELIENGHARDDRQEWLQARLAGQAAEPARPSSLQSLHKLLEKAADARQAVRERDDPADSRVLLRETQRSLSLQLEAGGAPLKSAMQAYLEQNEPRHSGVWQQFGILTRRAQ